MKMEGYTYGYEGDEKYFFLWEILSNGSPSLSVAIASKFKTNEGANYESSIDNLRPKLCQLSMTLACLIRAMRAPHPSGESDGTVPPSVAHTF